MKRRKTKKVLPIALLVLMIVIPITSAYAFAKEDSIENIPVYLEISDTFDAKKFYQIFSEEDIKGIEGTGRQVIDMGDTVVVYIKTQPAPKEIGDVNLYIDGEKVPVNLDGTISIHQNNKKSTVPVISIDDENIICAIPSLTQTKEKEIIFKISGEYVLEIMQEKEEQVRKETSSENNSVMQKGYGDRYFPGDWVHCNRFNGHMSDSIHYNKKTDLELALKNFYGSDCDASVKNFGPCVSFMHKFCNQAVEAAACSRLTRHANGMPCSRTFHLHYEPAEWR